jgi:hypothetical protein
METDTEGHLPFLDKETGDPTVFWAIECTLNLPIPSCTLTLGPNTTHPTSKLYFLLWCTGLELCAINKLHAELLFLRDFFRQNGYSDRQIHRVLNRRSNISQRDVNEDSVAFLPYVGAIFNRSSKVYVG